MCRVRFYFFPSICSRPKREIIYVSVEDLIEKEEKELEVDKYEKISEKRVINCEEFRRNV